MVFCEHLHPNCCSANVRSPRVQVARLRSPWGATTAGLRKARFPKEVHSELPPLRRWPQDWSSRLCWTVPAAGQVGIPTRIQAEDNGGGTGGNKQAPTPKAGPKKAPAAKSNKPKLKKTDTGHSTNVKPGTPTEPPALVKDFPPLTPVQAQVSCWGGAVSGPSSSPSPTETALQQQIGELRRQNQILARKIQELEAKQVGSSEPVQEAEAEDRDDGSSVTSRLTSVSRQDADTVSNSVLKAMQPWVIAQIKNTTQTDSPQVKRKPASRQAAEEGFSGPAPGPDRSSAP
ncbi:hypothetical protein MRX96_049578 [Rhipicephalus microplus]